MIGLIVDRVRIKVLLEHLLLRLLLGKVLLAGNFLESWNRFGRLNGSLRRQTTVFEPGIIRELCVASQKLDATSIVEPIIPVCYFRERNEGHIKDFYEVWECFLIVSGQKLHHHDHLGRNGRVDRYCVGTYLKKLITSDEIYLTSCVFGG